MQHAKQASLPVLISERYPPTMSFDTLPLETLVQISTAALKPVEDLTNHLASCTEERCQYIWHHSRDTKTCTSTCRNFRYVTLAQARTFEYIYVDKNTIKTLLQSNVFRSTLSSVLCVRMSFTDIDVTDLVMWIPILSSLTNLRRIEITGHAKRGIYEDVAILYIEDSIRHLLLRPASQLRAVFCPEWANTLDVFRSGAFPNSCAVSTETRSLTTLGPVSWLGTKSIIADIPYRENWPSPSAIHLLEDFYPSLTHFEARMSMPGYVLDGFLARVRHTVKSFVLTQEGIWSPPSLPMMPNLQSLDCPVGCGWHMVELDLPVLKTVVLRGYTADLASRVGPRIRFVFDLEDELHFFASRRLTPKLEEIRIPRFSTQSFISTHWTTQEFNIFKDWWNITQERNIKLCDAQGFELFNEEAFRSVTIGGEADAVRKAIGDSIK